MGKKKFIDKKKSVTLHLLARDSSDPIYHQEPENDRVFVRVDNNPVTIKGLNDNDEDEDDGFLNDPDSIFADAPDDEDCDDGFGGQASYSAVPRGGLVPLPDHVRREILELGFPDDGYNYLTHMREIRNTGGGSSYFNNPKANLHDVPHDVKGYDASRLWIKEVSEDTREDTSPKTLYNVAAKTVNVRVKKAADPEIAELLDENESDSGSDLEEYFVSQANLPEEGSGVYFDNVLTSASELQEEMHDEFDSVTFHESHTEVASKSMVEVVPVQSAKEMPRVQRLLDQQFDLLEHQEYGTDSDDDYVDVVAKEDALLAEKLYYVLKDRNLDDIDIDGNYKAPADTLHDKDKIQDEEVIGTAANLLRRCAEYGQRYENEGEEDQEVVISEESSDESEIWDCETIVSTYSNFDNHPGRINDPGFNRRKKLSETISGVLKSGTGNMITLGGKERLPLDYVSHSKKVTKESVEVKAELPKRKPHGQESKEEKKERKTAVKEEKREARRLKKERKELYRDEANRAQKVAAVTGPSSYHLM